VTTDERWERVAEAIVSTPGALPEETRRAIARDEDPPELAALLDKVRRAAYTIGEADVAGLDDDVVVEAALAAALGVALDRRAAALEAVERA
jgi:hypothetical protein